MAKESLYTPPKSPVFRETFSDEQTTRLLGGVPTSVVYSGGIATFSSSSILYAKNFRGTYSLRIKFTAITPTNNKYLLDFRTNSGVGYLYFDSGTTISSSSGTNYVDGVATSVVSSLSKEIIVSGISLTATFINLMYNYLLAGNAAGSIELFEIYNYTLTSQEVANLYVNKRYDDVYYSSGVTEILNVDAKNGAIQNKWNSTVTNTATTLVRDGNIWAMEFLTNGSKIDCGTYDTLLGNKTLIMWVKPYYISSLTGSFNAFTNGQFNLQADFGGSGAWYFSRTNFTGTYISAANTISENQWQMMVVTSTSTGVSVIYKNAVSIASGTVTTPVAGTNMTIGNGTSAGKPRVSGVRVIDGILTAQEISQLFSNERRNYGI